MSEQHFEKMDQEWIKATQELREKKVSDGILKGFSASVERRILSHKQTPHRAASPAWAPAMIVLVIASVVVLRTPMLSTPFAPIVKTVDYAQLQNTENVNDEIAALKELGVWNEEDEVLLGAADAELLEDLELSSLDTVKANIA